MSCIVVDRLNKSYSAARPLGFKELLVGRHRHKRESRFSRHWALRDVSFCVERGDAFAVVGENGSGKSTLLSLLLGSIRPDSGSIRVNGRVASLLALGAGFHPELTGRQNVFLYGSILGMRVADVRDRFARILDFSEIGDAIDDPIRTYSSGMIARLGFSTIIHTPADVLLIDEVLGVGDMNFQLKCRRFLQEFKLQGTLVIVSHDLDSLERLCDVAVWLDRGQIVSIGPAANVLTAYRAAESSRP